jgi:HEAT repeat protein
MGWRLYTARRIALLMEQLGSPERAVADEAERRLSCYRSAFAVRCMAREFGEMASRYSFGRLWGSAGAEFHRRVFRTSGRMPFVLASAGKTAVEPLIEMIVPSQMSLGERLSRRIDWIRFTGRVRYVNSHTRKVAEDALDLLGEPSTERLAELVDSPVCTVRDFAGEFLVARGAEGREVLLHAAREGRDYKVCINAGKWLQQYPQGFPIEIVLEWLDGNNYFLTMEALSILRAQGDSANAGAVLKLAVGHPDTMRCRALEVLVELNPELAVEPAIAMFKETDPDERYDVVCLLAATNDERAVAPLCEVLRTAWLGDYCRVEAAHGLGRLAYPGSVEGLAACIDDADKGVRRAVVGSLARLHDERGVAALLDICESAADHEKIAAAVELAESGYLCGADVLCLVAESAASRDRLRAARELLRISDPRATDLLCRIAESETGETRGVAARMLCLENDPRGYEIAVKMLREREAGAHAVVPVVVERNASDLETAMAMELIMESFDDLSGQIQYSLVGVFQKWDDPRAVEFLIGLVDNSTNVGARAIVLLGQKRDPRAVEPLLNLLAETDARQPTRCAKWGHSRLTIQALGRIGDPRAIEPVLGFLDRHQDVVGRGVVDGLCEFGDPRCVDFMLRCACMGNVEYPWIDNATLFALERMGTDEARGAADYFLASMHLHGVSPEMQLLLRQRGLHGVIDEYPRLINADRTPAAALVYHLALERSGSLEMAKDILASQCHEFAKLGVRQWAERNGHPELAARGE